MCDLGGRALPAWEGLSQFLATEQPLCQVRERFLPSGRAVSAHTARALAVAEGPAHPSPTPSQSLVGTPAAAARVAAAGRGRRIEFRQATRGTDCVFLCLPCRGFG